MLQVRAVQPKSGGHAARLRLPGTLQGIYEAQVYARANGYVQQWFKDIGQPVKKGELLAVIASQQVSELRSELAAAVKMPINVFIIYWRIFRNRGLVGPKAQGRIKGSAASIAVMSRRLAVGGDKVQSLWATALGRRTL